MRRIIFITNVLFLFIFLIAAIHELKSQPPCNPEIDGLYFEIPHLTDYPPLTTDMPYDVLIGYIASDSACKNVHYDEITNFVNNQSYNDTLRYIMRFYYQMADYNPIKFYQFLKFSPQSYKTPPSYVKNEVLDRIRITSPNPTIHRLLLASTIIAHVEVTDTFTINQNDEIICKNLSIVSANILDTIKGNFIPECTSINGNELSKVSTRDLNDNCLQFEYCYEWTTSFGEKLVDSSGIGWIKQNHEYIVFLGPRIICSDTTNTYMTLMPEGRMTATFGMYPVIDNIVHDPNNEFGLGETVPIIEFKNQLQMYINEIINYGE